MRLKFFFIDCDFVTLVPADAKQKLALIFLKMSTSEKSNLKRKSVPSTTEPHKKSSKVENKANETYSKLSSLRKSDLVKYCEGILEEMNKLVAIEKENSLTIINLEKTVAELREKCANTPVYLCSDCDYLAECIHDFNDHTHSVDDNNNEENTNFQCNFCDEVFETLSEVMDHKKLIHTSHVQHCKNFLENVCLYENSCWFLHSETLKNMEPSISCNFCEKKFRTKVSLRDHMKKKHIQMVSKCKDENECNFGPQKCWFLHQQNIENAYKIAKYDDQIVISENIK